MESKTFAVHDQCTHIRRQQMYQTELLEEVLQRFERQYQNIDSLALAVLNLVKSSQQKQLPVPSELKSSCDQYLDIIHGASNPHVNIVGTNINQPEVTLIAPYCTCNKVHKRGRRTSASWLFFRWTRYDIHPPPCPLATVAQRTSATRARLKFCFGGLGYLIEANLAWSNSFVSPYFSIRYIVPRNSPLFIVVDTYSKFIMRENRTGTRPEDLLQQNIEATVATVKALTSLIRKGRGSMRDVDPDGNTLAHVSSRFPHW